jgi:acetyl-CoA carboxylase biotin carboxyl carrier protein
MDQDEAARVRALGEIATEFDLDAIRVRSGETEIEIVRREPSAPAVAYAVPPAANAVPAAPAPASAGEAAPATGAPANVRRVTAPVVGVFYRAPSPGAESFVEVGSRVEVGQTLCILEAMKLMNEITTDHAGVVVRILVENGELVSLGQELFWIEP